MTFTAANSTGKFVRLGGMALPIRSADDPLQSSLPVTLPSYPPRPSQCVLHTDNAFKGLGKDSFECDLFSNPHLPRSYLPYASQNDKTLLELTLKATPDELAPFYKAVD